MFTTSGDRAGRRRNIWNPPPAVTVIQDKDILKLPTVDFPLNIPRAPFGWRVKVYALTYFISTRYGAYGNFDPAYVDFHAGPQSGISSYLAYGPVDDAGSTPALTAVTDFMGSVDLKIYDVAMPVMGAYVSSTPGTSDYVQSGPPTFYFDETDNIPWVIGMYNNGADLNGGGSGNYLRVTAYYSLELMGR